MMIALIPNLPYFFCRKLTMIHRQTKSYVYKVLSLGVLKQSLIIIFATIVFNESAWST